MEGLIKEHRELHSVNKAHPYCIKLINQTTFPTQIILKPLTRKSLSLFRNNNFTFNKKKKKITLECLTMEKKK